jgi:non-heme chloroperoxidase
MEYTQFGRTALHFSKIVKGATLKIYPGAPHGLTFTHKEQFNEDLLAFLKSYYTLINCSA